MSSTTLPPTVACLLQPDLQKPEVIRTTIPLQLPAEGSDEHLVKVECVAPCATELFWGKDFPDHIAPNKRYVTCFEYSGTIVQAPHDSPFQPGAAIFAAGRYNNTGHARQYSIARTSELALKPGRLSWEDAASIPISATTAYQTLFEHAGFARGWKDEAGKAANSKKRLLITAASGGVGVWATQLARCAGFTDIVAVCGPRNVDFVKSLGASEVIDYTKQRLGDWAKDPSNAKADLVLDMVGGQTVADCWSAVKDDGLIVSVCCQPNEHRPSGKDGVRSLWFIFEPRGGELQDIAALVESGAAKAVVDSVWGFDEYEKAFKRVDEGHARGKVIIKI